VPIHSGGVGSWKLGVGCWESVGGDVSTRRPDSTFIGARKFQHGRHRRAQIYFIYSGRKEKLFGKPGAGGSPFNIISIIACWLLAIN